MAFDPRPAYMRGQPLNQPKLQPGQTVVGGRVVSSQRANPKMYDLTTEAGNLAYAQLNDEQRRAVDRQQELEQISQSEKQMMKILKQQPAYKSSFGSKEVKGFQKEAYGTGPLAEYQAMREQARQAAKGQQESLQRGLSDELQNQSIAQGGAQANAYSQLAQGGGLSSGARERIASNLGNQSLAARQGARLQQMRGAQDVEQGLAEQQMGLTAKEAADRRAMQNAYMQMQSGETAARNQFEQEKYGKKADVLSGLARARVDATTNAYRRAREE
jgi:hypothetical protein